MNGEKKSELIKRQPYFEDRQYALKNLLNILKQKKHFFILTVFLACSGTFLGHFFKVQTFTASAILFIEPEDEISAAEFLLNKNASYNQNQRLDKYINYLSSDSFFMDVAQKIKFSDEINSLNLIAPHKKSKLSLQYWTKYFFEDEDLNNSEIQDREDELLVPIEGITSFLRGTISIQYEYHSPFITIQAKTLDPVTSRVIANLVATEFTNLTNDHSISEIHDIETFIQNEKSKTELAIRELDKKLIEFKQKYNIISSEQSSDNLATRLNNIDSEIQISKLKEKENQKILKLLKTQRKQSLNKIFNNEVSNSDFASAETSFILQKKIDQLKNEKSTYLSQGLSEDHWRLKRINSEINTTVQRLKKITLENENTIGEIDPDRVRLRILETEETLKGIKARVTTLQTAKKELAKEIETLPSIQQNYLQLENQFKIEVETLSSLEKRLKDLEIQKISTKKKVKIDQVAKTSLATPKGSLLAKLTFSSIIAIFLGFLIVLSIEAIDPKVKRRKDLYDCGMEFLGEIPKTETSALKKSAKKVQFGSPKDLICKHKPDSIEAVAFKYIRARLESYLYKNKKKSLVLSITSSTHDEGKSFVTANLAYSLAQLDKKVVIVDADLRRPSQSAFFGISSRKGLTDLMSMNIDLKDILIKDEHPNLDILPAGFTGDESTELLSNNKFRLLIEFLSERYDYVLIDTPPIFAVVDAAVIASYSDIPILISNYNKTRKTDLYESYNELLQLSYKEVYGIINRSTVSNSKIHYYGYPTLKAKDDIKPPYAKRNSEEENEFLKKLIS